MLKQEKQRLLQIGLSETEIRRYSRLQTKVAELTSKLDEITRSIKERGRKLALQVMGDFCHKHGTSNKQHLKRDRRFDVVLYVDGTKKTYSTEESHYTLVIRLTSDFNKDSIWVIRRNQSYWYETCYWRASSKWDFSDVEDIMTILLSYKFVEHGNQGTN